MSRILVCDRINCPYWSNDHKASYGCQRWGDAATCHLRVAHPDFDSNQYALYTSAELNWSAIDAENRAFFLEDPKYCDDAKFQDQHPDWGSKFPKRTFQEPN